MTGLERLPAIGLETLTARASLMTRTDRKYLVPPSAVGALVDDLADRLQVLEIDDLRTFRYASIYYDTPDLLAFRGAAGRRRRRFTVRRRDYLDTGAAFLEVKTSTGRGESSKARIPLPADGPGSGGARALTSGPLDSSAVDFVRGALADAGCPCPDDVLAPVLGTRYGRTTLLDQAEDARITIDTDLTWTVPDGPADSDDHRVRRLAVVETKAGTRPSAADRLLWSLGPRPTRLSKYATGMALTRSELPANRWHRTLRTLSADLGVDDPSRPHSLSFAPDPSPTTRVGAS